jgi:hypothetical protein
MSIQSSCDFSLTHYGDIITEIRDRFRVVDFRGGVAEHVDGARRAVILRHDIDLSIEIALEMARLEDRVGVRSTYFVRLDARNYNALFLQSYEGLRRILDLGHDIGLHYSGGTSHLTGESPFVVIDRQLRILRELLSFDVRVGAAHEPDRLKIETEQVLANTDLEIEAYQPRFVRDMKYISESGGRWRERCACKWLDRDVDLCILTHPFWWYEQTPLERY